MEDRGGFTASWGSSVVGQSHLAGMLQSEPGGADRGADQRPWVLKDVWNTLKPPKDVPNSMRGEDFYQL